MNRLSIATRLAPSAHRLRVLSLAQRTRFALPTTIIRSYSAELAPETDYNGYVTKWRTHFSSADLDDFELERGLNLIFAADWVPSLEVIQDALTACRRLNTFPTAVRILEALENKVEKKEQYQQYLKALKPMIDDLGIVERKELGTYNVVRDSKWCGQQQQEDDDENMELDNGSQQVGAEDSGKDDEGDQAPEAAVDVHVKGEGRACLP
ncbi:hypothetical protein SmJEL517_g00314 [Synchytrium microbalum]|uniref:Cytochrome c oxidase subunit 6, mitochondrial n=1 Tax=Synchytrium microbalum TaxID=1806994 RepID=A0A507CAJ6_9FUNG|nr:uncharacterized protein SmJEL517_g00314 [Synchytrium microbalum]TPX38077.1 hypothetical protein SmJEL517_g00314 [Synchytrium microbalum]